MTQQEILEGNKLIAEFMGNEKVNKNTSDDVYFHHYKYHSSWDWLVPACRKWGILSETENIGCKDYEDLSDALDAEISTYLIEPTFNQLVLCIKWYNQQNKNQ